MAERSTAAVDVAAGGGDEPLTTQADQTTADEAEQHEHTAADEGTQHTQKADAATQPQVRTPELHSGHKLARRYRLEECVTRLDGFSSWRAVDEKLRRAVGVHLLPADHPRARSVLSAARSSALLGDPRFVQVLDAVEENDLVYVVHEWLPDATELTSLLAAGPLEPHDAYQLVSQLSQAMAAAHREGLAHLRLTPSAVLRSSTGQYRIRGLAVNAALRGIKSDTPQRDDTEAIGALLYASLTQRWPYEVDAYGLSGLPKDAGRIAPDQVRAGVHRGLSELAMRALVNDGATASRLEQPCTTPEELAKAVAELPRIKPPEPAFTAAPEYQRTTYQQGTYGRMQPGATQPVPTPPQPLEGRTGKALKWGVSALLIAALGLGSWQLADALMERGGSADPGTSQQSEENGDGKQPAPKPLGIKDAYEFAPLGPAIKADQVSNAIDGEPGTSWVTSQYKGHSNFGNLPNRKDGSGIVVAFDRVRSISELDVTMYREGQKVEILAAAGDTDNPSKLSDFTERITKPTIAGSKLEAKLEKPLKARYILIRIIDLPSDGAPNLFRGGITDISATGS
ncbi:protein kinase family protein [Streptomyces mesophilus]|uniref:protein kinase family protein n=1 Tax=Streptomyces mesophilus TaxID=1775132 RepID=UPI0033293D74